MNVNNGFSKRNYKILRNWGLTETVSPCMVITKSVLSSGSLATSNEHLGLAMRSCKKQLTSIMWRGNIHCICRSLNLSHVWKPWYELLNCWLLIWGIHWHHMQNQPLILMDSHHVSAKSTIDPYMYVKQDVLQKIICKKFGIIMAGPGKRWKGLHACCNEGESWPLQWEEV